MDIGKVVDLAKKTAKNAEGIRRYKLGAVLFNKRKIINAKGNTKKTHPLVLKFSEYPCLHAEAYSIISHGLDNCADLSLCVVRCDSTGRATMAKPCEACYRLIQFVGIKEIYYTNWKGEVEWQQVL